MHTGTETSKVLVSGFWVIILSNSYIHGYWYVLNTMIEAIYEIEALLMESDKSQQEYQHFGINQLNITLYHKA